MNKGAVRKIFNHKNLELYGIRILTKPCVSASLMSMCIFVSMLSVCPRPELSDVFICRTV